MKSTSSATYDYDTQVTQVGIDDSTTTTSVDCLACRFTSGGGVIAAGLYVGYHAKSQPIAGKMILSSVSFALCCLGTCRLLNLPPFGRRTTAA